MLTRPIGSFTFADALKHLRYRQTLPPAATVVSKTGAPAPGLAQESRGSEQGVINTSEEGATPGATPQNSNSGNNHLYYGGMPAKTPYKVGCKPQAGVTFKKQRRFELIARMENAALPEGQIAALLGLSVPRLRTIKQTPDYLKARMAITLGLIVDTDSSLDQIREQRKAFLIHMLPPALQVVANVINTPPANFAEKRLQVSVAQDLLDREGTFAKISRTEVKPVEHFDWEQADASAHSALDVVKGTLRVSQSEDEEGVSKKNIEKIIEITKHFSAGKGLTSEGQQAALDELEEA